MKRISAVLPQVLYDDLKKISDLQNRSLNYVISKLLEQAIKEKNRKRCKKEDTSLT